MKNPLTGIEFFKDPISPAARINDPRLSPIANASKGYWYTGQYRKEKITGRVQRQIARHGSATPILVIYNIPNRDLGSYSKGGAQNAKDYLRFIDEFIGGVGDSKPIIILEPDALASCQNMKIAKRMARIELIRQAVDRLSKTNAYVYIDIGNPEYINDPALAGDLLSRVGVCSCAGFSVNVSNFYSTDICEKYAVQVSRYCHDAHFVIDTSRNGVGHIDKTQWCNPPGRRLGTAPTTGTNHPQCDAYLYIKPPGESDGECNGGPRAGTFWKEYALELCQPMSTTDKKSNSLDELLINHPEFLVL